MTGGWIKRHKKELHVLCYSPHIIKVIKSKRIRWADHVPRMCEKRLYVSAGRLKK